MCVFGSSSSPKIGPYKPISALRGFQTSSRSPFIDLHKYLSLFRDFMCVTIFVEFFFIMSHNFLLFPGVKRAGYGADHPLPFSAKIKERVLSTEGTFTGVKRPEDEVDLSASSSVEFKNWWDNTANLPYAFLACTVTTINLSLVSQVADN